MSFEYNGSEEMDGSVLDEYICTDETILKIIERINSAFLDPSPLLDNISQQWKIWRWVVR